MNKGKYFENILIIVILAIATMKTPYNIIKLVLTNAECGRRDKP